MARPKILVFQHVPYEPLGTLDPLLKESGFRIRYVNLGRNPDVRPTLGKYAAIIVLALAMMLRYRQSGCHSSGDSCINATCSRSASTCSSQ